MVEMELAGHYHLSTMKVDLLMIMSRKQGSKAKNDSQAQ